MSSRRERIVIASDLLAVGSLAVGGFEMGICNDPKVTYLRKFGYNVIALPRAGIRPLAVGVLHRHQQLVELGYLPEIWSSKEAVPTTRPDEDVTKMGRQSTDKLQANAGVDVLSNLLQALGTDPAKVKGEYSSAATLQFHFKNVARERVTAFTLGSYLAAGQLSSDDPFVQRYFVPREKVYVVTEVLKSDAFGVSAFDQKNTGLEIKIPVIQQAVSGSGAVKVEQVSSGSVEFSGPTKLPFAFVAAEVAWTGKRWEVVDFPDPGEIHLSEAAPQKVSSDGFVTLWKGAVLFGEGPVEFGGRPSTAE